MDKVQVRKEAEGSKDYDALVNEMVLIKSWVGPYE